MPAYLNGRHTIFGHCDPLSLVTDITKVDRGPMDRPITEVTIKKVTIAHDKKAGAKPKAKEKEKEKAAP
jgi:hypothetical protein